MLRLLSIFTIATLSTLLIAEHSTLSSVQLFGVEVTGFSLMWLLFVLPKGAEYGEE